MILFTTFLILGITCFYLGYIQGKHNTKKDLIDKTLESFFKYAYKEEINPVTKDIYDLFISDNGMRHFQKFEYVIRIPMLGINIWHRNNIEHREITETSNEIAIYNLYGKTIKEINDSLNLGDKAILDKICQEVIINQDDLANTILLDSRYKF